MTCSKVAWPEQMLAQRNQEPKADNSHRENAMPATSSRTSVHLWSQRCPPVLLRMWDASNPCAGWSRPPRLWHACALCGKPASSDARPFVSRCLCPAQVGDALCLLLPLARGGPMQKASMLAATLILLKNSTGAGVVKQGPPRVVRRGEDTPPQPPMANLDIRDVESCPGCSAQELLAQGFGG